MQNMIMEEYDPLQKKLYLRFLMDLSIFSDLFEKIRKNPFIRT